MSGAAPALPRPTPAPPPTADPSSLAETAYRILEEKIVTLALAPGSVLTERALCEAVGLGRTPVREALLRLKQDHLVDVRPRRGIVIRPIEIEYSLMAMELRHLVEGLIVRRAATLATPAERRHLQDLAGEIEAAAAASDPLAFMRADRDFNDTVAAAARHPVAAKAIAPLHAVSRRLGTVFGAADGRGFARTGAGHARLMRAIAEGDADRAAGELDRLLALTREIALAVGESRTPATPDGTAAP